MKRVGPPASMLLLASDAGEYLKPLLPVGFQAPDAACRERSVFSEIHASEFDVRS